ncbi:Sushi repeat-containing protein SRPX2 [Holothuria leucospilota]|uniref:Sushi repeat-containing protein SRPX2 n=1 Tax=Holothuria leucospilota TaxID=206669 RepID=A0A9Q1CSN9_HOLLE|nr:Sushi repeat-containing protein SRPX2 [Holothuria leucospilota]
MRRRRAGSSHGFDKNAEEIRKHSHPSEKDCEPELTHPTHGSVICSQGNDYKSVCKYSCDEGYQLSDPESTVVVCTGKKWSAKKPVCVAVPTN